MFSRLKIKSTPLVIGQTLTLNCNTLYLLIALHYLLTQPCKTLEHTVNSYLGQHDRDATNPQLYHHETPRAEALVQAPTSGQTTSELPDFEEPIGNHTVAIGKDVQLACRISNLNGYRTAWLRVEDKGILSIHNNVITRNYRIGHINADDGKTFVLTIKNVQPSDKGGYMCQINSVPMRYAVGYLDVLTPPKFDDAAHRAEGSTSGAEDTSSDTDASVTTVASPTGSGAVVSVNEGANATLTCKASGHPEPTITWRREDNEPILLNGAQPGDGLAKVEGASLSISSVSRLNSGAYLCIASNGIQPSASRRQVLDVQFAPVLRLPQTEFAAHVGQRSVKLSCIVDSKPPASHHWVKLTTTPASRSSSRTGSSTDNQPAGQDDVSLADQEELTSSDKHDIVIKEVNSERTEMLLNIRQVDERDFANYKCIAKNSLGSQSSDLALVRHHDRQSDRGGSRTSQGLENPDHQNDQQQTNDSQSGSRAANSAGRTHTRSSWLQRPSNLSSPKARNEPSTSSSASTISVRLASLANQQNILLLLCNLLVVSIWLNQ